MADERCDQPDDDRPGAPDPADGDVADTASGPPSGPAAGASGGDGEEAADDVGRGDLARRVRSVVARNRGLLGRLVLHYGERDVTVVVDGDAAMRILAIVAGRAEGVEDLVGPYWSDAANAWVVFDRRPLAVSWLPGRPEPRMASVDPVV